MKTKTLLLCILAIVASPMAMAQFDFGMGQSGPSTPWTEFNLNAKTKVKLDFRNASIDMVLAFYQKTTGITIVKDPALTGPVTVTSASEVGLSEAFQILNAVVSLKNYELKKEGNFLVVRPKAVRNQGRGGMEGMDLSALSGMFGQPQTILRVYPITHANAAQVARVLNEVFAQQAQDPFSQMMQQMMSARGGQQQGDRGGNPFQRGGSTGFGGRGGPTSGQTVRASFDDYSNTVIVNAPEKDHAQVASLIKEIDKQTEQPLQPRVFKLEFASADTVAPVVSNVLVANAPKGRGGQGNQQVPFEQRIMQARQFGSANAAFGNVVSDLRTNSLIITATEENLAFVAKVIKELDTEVVYENSTFVFPLSNARADSIAGLLQQAFGTRGNTSQGRNTQGGFGQQNRNNMNRNNQNRNQGGGGGNAGGGGGGGAMRGRR